MVDIKVFIMGQADPIVYEGVVNAYVDAGTYLVNIDKDRYERIPMHLIYMTTESGTKKVSKQKGGPIGYIGEKKNGKETKVDGTSPKQIS